MNPFLRKIGPHIAAILGFLLISLFYFFPQVQGRVIEKSDVIQFRGGVQEVTAYKKKTGETSLWTNSMFGGMPTYQINVVSAGNYIRQMDKVASLGIKSPIGQFFVAMAGFYLLLICLGVNYWVSIIGAFAFSFSTNNLTMFEAGHLTKLKAISYLPLMAVGMLLAYQKKYLWGGLLFAVGFALNMFSNHIQMTYYFFLTLLFFAVAQAIYSYQQKEMANFWRATGVLVLAGIIGLATSASNLWVTYEYSRDTMRGKPILEASENPDPNSSSETEGLAWDYAMAWSNGTIDMFASIIPGVAGGGTGEIARENSILYNDPGWRQLMRANNGMAPLYWGKLPFTSGPIYFGIIVFFLFLMGLVLVKGPVKWWLGLGVLLTVLLSMGKNLEGFNRLFFDYLPLFNKFRTPNSVLSITAFLMPFLGFLALGNIVLGKYDKKEMMRALLIAGGATAAICLFFITMGSSFFDFTHPNDANYAQNGFNIEVLKNARIGHTQADSLRALLYLAIASGIVWAFIQNRIKAPMLLLGIGLLTFFDLWSVGRRYVNNDNFIAQNRYENRFQPRPVDDQILQDSDPNFRVYDATISTFNSASSSYFHKTIGGGHPAKLQRYADLIDRHFSQGNQKVVDMLNAKYFIINGSNQQPVVQQNPGALGNAWFVDTIIQVNSANAEIDSLYSFNPRSDAIIHQEFENYIAGLTPTKSGSIRLTEYKPNHLTYESSNTNQEQLALFSEIWYGPNKGWQAYIDGNPVAHIRANYVLRALKIPAGTHTIEFKFDPASFRTGKLVSQLSSGLLWLTLLGFIGYFGYQSYSTTPAEEPKKKPIKKKTTPTQSTRKPTKTKAKPKGNTQKKPKKKK